MATVVQQNIATPLAENADDTKSRRTQGKIRFASVVSGDGTATAAKSHPTQPVSSRNPSLKRNGAPAGASILAAPKRADAERDLTSTVTMIAANLSPISSGPSCNSYSVPPRPKPGRKPALDKPSEKRKAQNRDAQRAFRERKVAHTVELKKDITDLRQAYNEALAENGSLKRNLQEVEQSRQQVEEQIRERDHLISQLQGEVCRYREQEQEWTSLKRTHDEAQQKMQRDKHSIRTHRSVEGILKTPDYRQSSNGLLLNSFHPHSPITPPQQSPKQDASCGNCAQTGYCKCVEDFTVDPSTVPPTTSDGSSRTKNDRWMELEQDFTTKAPANPAIAVPEQPTTTKVVHEPGCGFCDDSTDCPCHPRVIPISAAKIRSAPNPMDISSIVEPGTCVKCQSDPEQRRFCIEMSKGRQLSNEPPTSAAKRPRLDDGRPRTLTCNELYQASKHVVVESRRSGKSKALEIESMFNSFTRTQFGATGSLDAGDARPGMRYRTFSTSEIDGAEALTALQHSRRT